MGVNAAAEESPSITEAPTSIVRPNREQRRAGFRRQRKEYRLHFEDTALEGLVVHMRSVPVGTVLDLAEMAEVAEDLTPEGIRTLGRMFELLAEAIIDWNLEDDNGALVPASIDGVRTLELDEAMLLIKEWIQAAAGVARPLDRPSTGGDRSPVASLPMEPLSPSPAN